MFRFFGSVKSGAGISLNPKSLKLASLEDSFELKTYPEWFVLLNSSVIANFP
jgi:hypothetical protein